MSGQTDFTVKAEPDNFKNTLFLAMELSRATWLVATFAPRLGDKISVHAIPGGDTKRLLELIGRLQAKLRGWGVSKVRTVCCYVRAIVGFVQGDPQSCRVVRAPSPEEEDARRLHRERQRLVRERTGHLNRIKDAVISQRVDMTRLNQAESGITMISAIR